MNFLTIEELYSITPPEQRFLIEGLLPACGLTMFVGKPKGSKSTLIRQALVAIATGTQLLGHPTIRSSVLYLATEELASEVRRHFAGTHLPRDAPLEIHVGGLEADWLSALRSKLTENPEIKHVVIDPLLLAISVRDANDYAPMLKALARLVAVPREFQTAILCIHHSRKSLSADSGDNMLGSTAIRGSADATWQVIKKEDGTRTFQTEMRYGVDLPPTKLSFDKESQISTLELTEAFVSKQDVARTAERIEEDILARADAVPLSTKEEILADVKGNALLKHKTFRSLEKKELLQATGAGVKGDPFRYRSHLPTEPTSDSDTVSAQPEKEK